MPEPKNGVRLWRNIGIVCGAIIALITLSTMITGIAGKTWAWAVSDIVNQQKNDRISGRTADSLLFVEIKHNSRDLQEVQTNVKAIALAMQQPSYSARKAVLDTSIVDHEHKEE